MARDPPAIETPAPVEPLAPADGVSVYAMKVGPADPVRLRRLRERLSDEERQRADRLKMEQHRWTYVVAHALLQRRLQAATGRAPCRFTVGPHGRPELEPPFGDPPLRFNLTHTEGLVAVALGVGHDIGVDAERMEPATPIHDLALRFFAPEEAAFIAEGRETEGLSRFFRIWTAKEAVVKAVGLGLRLPLDSFCVTVDPLGVVFKDASAPHRGAWRLRQVDMGEHCLTVAVRLWKERPTALAVEVREVGLDWLG